MRKETSEERDFYNYIMDNYKESQVQIIKLGVDGYPDRIVLIRNSKVIWFEFKREDGQTSRGQDLKHKKLRRLRHRVYTVVFCEEAKQYLEHEIRKNK